ncbi:MAG: hypothetical protein M1812_001980 [Candelaria pacifica]|nr:MAG: hypothetical protein M1812_001980 [Candelaria pacifica]
MSTAAAERPWEQNDPKLSGMPPGDDSEDTPGAARKERSSSDETLSRENGHSATEQKLDHPFDSGEDAGESPPKPVGFFDSRLNKVRNQVFLEWARTNWAVLYHVEQNMPTLVVWIVDFDGQVAPYNTGEPPLVGPQVVKAADMMVNSPTPHLGYGSVPPSQFNNDPMQVRQAIYDYKAWAAFIINANATALLRAAVAQGNASYDPLGAMQLIYVQARDETTFANYVMPQLSLLQTQVTSMIGQMWATTVLQNLNASDPTALGNLQKVPQAISPAIGVSTFNLRPFEPAVVTPAVTVGLIYLIIISFFSFSFYLPTHMKLISPQGHPPIKFWQLILWRWLATIVAYFLLSLSYSMISLAFQIPFNNAPKPHTEVANNPNAYDNGSFVVFWMLNYVGMIALGLACENVAMVIGQPWTAFWLIFWVITNVSTSFYDIDLAPKFYFWGYAWPLHNIVEASRTIIFNLHSRIGLNFGILFIWAAINTALFPPACYFFRWKNMREQKKKG